MTQGHRLVVGILLATACGLACATDPNLLPNGDFSTTNGIAGWTAAGTGSVSFSSAMDATGGASGSMRIMTDATGRYAAADAGCFPAAPGAAYSIGGEVALADVPAAGSHVTVLCYSFGGSSCQGGDFHQLGPPVGGLHFSATGGFVALPTISGNFDGSARSTSCSVVVRTEGDATGVTTAFVDNLFFESSAPLASNITLGGYLSGNWYDPTQSGQGFQLEFTNQNNTLLAIWFTYAPDGSGQNWIFAQGPYESTTNAVTLRAAILSGGKFPPLFNNTDLHSTLWGTMTFVFTDCNHGQAIWNSIVPGYGSGSMPISRLTRIRGMTCPP